MKVDIEKYDVVIIGAGVIGSAVARELSRYKISAALLDKETDAAEGISKANSGVIHAGFNVKPGSLKAKFNLEGLTELPKLADELGVEYRFCKKLVVGQTGEEKKILEKLLGQGIKNSVPGLSIIGRKEIEKIQPNLTAEWALFSEKTGIVTPYLFTIALAENAHKNGVEVKLKSEVTSINKNKDGSYRIGINNKKFINCDWVINAAGLFSDKTAKMAGEDIGSVYPCRGEYFILDKRAGKELDTAVYPVPCRDNRGLGIHLTPTLNGNILIGPSAEYIDETMDRSTTAEVMYQLKREAFELMPQLSKYSFIRSFSGIRPKLFNSNSNEKFADFYIKESEVNPGFVNLHGIESPGLTSAPAIARYVVENIIGNKRDLREKEVFFPTWEKIERFNKFGYRTKDIYIKSDRNYSKLICRCEEISEAEVLKAINNPINAVSLDAVKKRTHSMMGRCQAGFCMSRIIELIKKEKKIPPTELVLNNMKSKVIFSMRKY